MGRPLSSNFFGAEDGKVAIKFHNGTSVVTGYVVRQVGSTRYEVTANGTDNFFVLLAQTTDEAENLVEGYGTIEATLADDSDVFVRNLQSHSLITTEGLGAVWNNENDDNAATLGVVTTPPAPTSAITVSAVGNQTTAVTFTVSGTFTGTAPTKLQYRINSGSWLVVSSPTIGSGTYSFSAVVNAAGTGTTISVRDFSGDVTGVSGTSAAFNVVDPV